MKRINELKIYKHKQKNKLVCERQHYFASSHELEIKQKAFKKQIVELHPNLLTPIWVTSYRNDDFCGNHNYLSEYTEFIDFTLKEHIDLKK